MPSYAQNPSNLGLSWLDSMMALSISADPAWSPPWFKQAQSAYYQGNPLGALGSLRLANRLSPQNQNYTWAWINLAREIGDPQLVLEACAHAAAYSSDSPQHLMVYWLCQADAQVMLNDYLAAETAFRQALAAQPGAPAALCGYAYFAWFNLENPALANDLFIQASADPDASLLDDCVTLEEALSLP